MQSLKLIRSLKARYPYAPNVMLEDKVPFKRMQQISTSCDKAFRAQCQLFDMFRDLNYLFNTSGNVTTVLYIAKLYGQIQAKVNEFKQLLSNLKAQELTIHYGFLLTSFEKGMAALLSHDVEVLTLKYNHRRQLDALKWTVTDWDPIHASGADLRDAYAKGEACDCN